MTLRGEHLRLYLRVLVGTQPATFLFADTDGGVLRLPELAPGVYDVVLLNEEVTFARARGGLVVDVKASASPTMVDFVLRNNL